MPTIVPLFVGPLVDFESGRALYLRFMFLVPGLLLAKLAMIPLGQTEAIAVAGFVTLLLVGGVAVAWNRLPHRRTLLAAVTLVLASFNAYPRIADATGIPLEDAKAAATASLRRELGLDALNTAVSV